MNWIKYHRYQTIDNFVKCLATEHPDKATLYTIGKSWEGRDMHLLKITKASRVAKKPVWIDGGIRAREWVSPSAVTFMMNELLENPKYDQLISNYDLYILPVANPDG